MSDEVAKLIGVPPGSPLLEEALTHPSYANEVRTAHHYQRLEFLGDAVLGLCAAELLYERFPDADEGSLTRFRARLVNAEALAAWAREAGVGAALRLGRGADAGGLRGSTSVLSDLVEALVAATYLDGGLVAARQTCRLVLGRGAASLEEDSGRDPKSELQERMQRGGTGTPTYEVVGTGGASHDPWFEVRVSSGGSPMATGRGRSKRLAERAAAQAALARIPLEGQQPDSEKEPP